MARFLLSRAVQALVSILGVSTIIFVVMHLSGDPTLLLVPDGASREDVALLRHQLGFDRPLAVQYVDYLAGLARGDLGTSLVQRVPVAHIVAARLPYTLLLAAGSLVVALGIGLPIGVATGVWRGTLVERLLMPVVLIGQSMPTFWSGILLILLCAVRWNVLPASGAGSAAKVGADFRRPRSAKSLGMDIDHARHFFRGADPYPADRSSSGARSSTPTGAFPIGRPRTAWFVKSTARRARRRSSSRTRSARPRRGRSEEFGCRRSCRAGGGSSQGGR